jgi:5-methylcytosine-specific restriction endonuclease McrA
LFYVGANHSFWRGGGNPNRGSGWIKLAAKIRQRDGYICQRCNRTQAENGERLAVDHIRPWRSFKNKSEANDPANLASLCKKCHGYKTSKVERAWLKGDMLPMQQYERAVKLPPLLAVV